MDNELVFLTIITIIVLGFCIANIVSYLINKNHIKETAISGLKQTVLRSKTDAMRSERT